MAGTIVDLLVPPLVDVQYRDQTTADGQPMRGDLPAAERQLLAHTGLQQVPIDLITRVAGTELISVSELQIVTVGTLFIKRHVKIDIVFVDDEIELAADRSEEHTSELQSLMRISYAVFCLKKNNINTTSQN